MTTTEPDEFETAFILPADTGEAIGLDPVLQDEPRERQSNDTRHRQLLRACERGPRVYAAPPAV